MTTDRSVVWFTSVRAVIPPAGGPGDPGVPTEGAPRAHRREWARVYTIVQDQTGWPCARSRGAVCKRDGELSDAVCRIYGLLLRQEGRYPQPEARDTEQAQSPHPERT